MISLQKAPCVLVESLESRALLSAVPIPHVRGDRAALKPLAKVVIPSIAGTSYSGTLHNTTANVVYDAVIAFTKETKVGAIHGTFTVSNSDGAYGQYPEAGTVNARHKFSMHGRVGKFTLSITGTLSADLTTLTGKFTSAAARQHGKGTFSCTLVTAN